MLSNAELRAEGNRADALENIEIITNALAGDSQDQREIAFIGLQTVAIMIQKNQDYGSSVFNVGAISPDITPEQGLRVRLGDKLSRINNLVAQPDAQRVSESITDTGHDASAYLLLWVIARIRESGSEVCGSGPILLHNDHVVPQTSTVHDHAHAPVTVSAEEQEDLDYINGAKQRVK